MQAVLEQSMLINVFTACYAAACVFWVVARALLQNVIARLF